MAAKFTVLPKAPSLRELAHEVRLKEYFSYGLLPSSPAAMPPPSKREAFSGCFLKGSLLEGAGAKRLKEFCCHAFLQTMHSQPRFSFTSTTARPAFSSPAITSGQVNLHAELSL